MLGNLLNAVPDNVAVAVGLECAVRARWDAA